MLTTRENGLNPSRYYFQRPSIIGCSVFFNPFKDGCSEDKCLLGRCSPSLLLQDYIVRAARYCHKSHYILNMIFFVLFFHYALRTTFPSLRWRLTASANYLPMKIFIFLQEKWDEITEDIETVFGRGEEADKVN